MDCGHVQVVEMVEPKKCRPSPTTYVSIHE